MSIHGMAVGLNHSEMSYYQEWPEFGNPCSDGMDVVFIFDYSSSMGSSINSAISGASDLVTTIDTLSGANDYRLGLVLVDEISAGGTPQYGSDDDYTSLPAAQKYTESGTSGNDIVLTAFEMMGPTVPNYNNGASFQTQLGKLNNGGGSNFVIGSGAGGPEPMDRGLDRVLNHDFAGAWRTGVARYIILITDASPSGLDDAFSAADVTALEGLATTALAGGYKVFVCGSGANSSITVSGVARKPYEEIAATTGGSTTTSFDSSTLEDEIVAGCTV